MKKSYIQPCIPSTAVFKDDIFKGKVLFCTGGGSGICRDMTQTMMRHGCDAVIVGRNGERLAKAAKELSEATGRKCIPAQADVRNTEALKAAVEKAIKELKRIDFVICGAAGNFLAPISGLSENAFKTVMEIDTMGSFNTVKATLPHIRNTHGAYLMVSATFHYRGTIYQAHVSAAKAGVDALSQVLAVEEGPYGVRSNVVSPGGIADTEGWDRLVTETASEKSASQIPGGRVGYKADISNAAVFLFSDAATYITGQVLVVDGGWEHLRTSLLPYPDGVLDPAAMQKLMNTPKAKSKL